MRVLAAAFLLGFLSSVAVASNNYESGGKVDEFIGAYTESYPITVPPFHGIEPKLSLQYHSGRGVGYVGVGWSLQGMSVIEVRDLYAASQFGRDYFLDGQLLLRCSQQQAPSPSCETTPGKLGPGQIWFSTQSETYLRIEYGVDPADKKLAFVVWKPNGTLHYYKEQGLRGRFLLTKVVDARGNTVSYEWIQAATTGSTTSTNYPSRILYNGTVIAFHYEQRALPETIQELGRLERMAWQLRVIDVCVGNPAAPASCTINNAVDPRRARAYSLGYRPSASTGRPLLVGVQMFGKDARIASNLLVSGSAMPMVTFQWSDRAPAYQKLDQANVAEWGSDWIRGMADFDGDGKTDFCRDIKSSQTSNLACVMSSGVDRQVGLITDWGATDTPTWIDWNGDGRSDLCRMSCYDNGGGSCEPHEDKNHVILCALSNGTSITDVQIGVPLPDGEEGAPGSRWFVDWNGDGRGDLCRATNRVTGGVVQPLLVCAMSTGSSYVDVAVSVLGDATASGTLDGALGYPETRAMVDWNGDGRTDFCRVVDGPAQYQESLFCTLNRTLEYDRTQLTKIMGDEWLIGVITDRGSADTQWFVDVNGDGSSDYCRLIGTADIHCAISTKVGLIDVHWATSQTKFGAAQSRRWGDVDGDRKMDMCFDGPGAYKECVISQGLTGVIRWGQGFVEPSWTNQHWMVDRDGDGRSEYCFTAGYAGGSGSKLTCIFRDRGMLLDLMIGTWNGAGGGTGVVYAPATKFGAARARIPVVESFTRSGGAEGAITQTFRYTEQAYDSFSRRLLGYRTVRIVDPCLPYETAPWQCPYTEITSRLDWRWPTAPARISRYGGYPAVEMTRQELVYADTGTRPYRHDLISDTRTQFEGGHVVATRRLFTHDRYGNITLVNDEGAITDTTGYLGNLADDDRLLATVFAYNSDAYVVDKAAQITGIDANGTVLTDVRYAYDKQSVMIAPTRGLVTEAQVWLDTEKKYLSSFMDYDGAGNLVRETDRNGNGTDFEYDPTYKVFLVKTTMPAAGTPAARQATQAGWDVRCNQINEDWDVNNSVTMHTFDALCRRTRSEVIAGAWEEIAYHDYAFPYDMPYVVVTQPGPTASAFTLANKWTRTHFDGYGRVTKVVKNGPYSGTEIIEKEITYNVRGKIATKTRPRYSTEISHAYSYAYDLRDRETAAQLNGNSGHPGDYKYTSYSMLTEIVRDGLNNPEMTVFDVRGRRLMAGSTDGYLHPKDLTRYSYDRRGNLARIEQATQLATASAITSYTWDSLGRKTSATESNAGTRTFQYDANGNLVIETDAAGTMTRYEYDALDRRTQKTTPYDCRLPCKPIVSTWRYDEPRGIFDNKGKLTTAIDASGTATYDYDWRGNLVEGGRTVNGSGPYTFRKVYDDAGRLLATTYPDNTKIGTATLPIRYDETGRIYSIPGVIESATYDASGVLTSYKTANGAKATYDTANPRGQVASYTVEGKKSTGSEGIIGEYEASGSRYQQFVLPNGLQLGDTITVSTCSASVQGASGTGDTYLKLMLREVHQPWMYERAANDNAYVPGCGLLSTITFTAYETSEVFIQASCAGGSACSGTVAVRLERNAQNVALNKSVYQSSVLDATCGPSASVVDGNTDGRWCTASSMLHTQHEANPWMYIDLGSEQDIRRVDVYNRSECPVCLPRLSNFDIYAWSYSTNSWIHAAYVPHEAAFPTVVGVRARTRFVMLRLRGTDYLNTPEVKVFGPGTGTQPLLDEQPVFEQARLFRASDGRIQSVSTNRSRTTWQYTYSSTQSRELWSATNANPKLSRTYETDNGNLTVAPPTRFGAAPGVQPHAVYSTGVDRFAYDANGNRTESRSGGIYEWNAARQLVSYGGVDYTYDADGYRLTKTFGSETTTYLGDDYEISSTTGEHTKYITLGGRLVAKQTTSGDTTYLFTDHIGSVILGLDAAGSPVLSTTYGPFGETLAGTDEGRGYTGQRKDENGLVYLHARFYDPQSGRFISPDPAISSASPIGMNRYAYALNDPINRTDIDGLGIWENVGSDVGEAARVTANFLSNINLVDIMQWISNESGHKAPVKKFLGGFNIGVGKSLALIVGKLHAANEGDWNTYGEMIGSELLISAAVAASILSYGTAAAPAVAIITAIVLPTGLTFIQTQDLDETRDAFFGTLGGVAGSIGKELATPAASPYLNAMKKEALDSLDALGSLGQKLKKLGSGGDGGGGSGGFGMAWGAISVLISADPMIVIESRLQATSVSPQGKLSSSSGTLFGHGYR